MIINPEKYARRSDESGGIVKLQMPLQITTHFSAHWVIKDLRLYVRSVEDADPEEIKCTLRGREHGAIVAFPFVVEKTVTHNATFDLDVVMTKEHYDSLLAKKSDAVLEVIFSGDVCLKYVFDVHEILHDGKPEIRNFRRDPRQRPIRTRVRLIFLVLVVGAAGFDFVMNHEGIPWIVASVAATLGVLLVGVQLTSIALSPQKIAEIFRDPEIFVAPILSARLARLRHSGLLIALISAVFLGALVSFWPVDFYDEAMGLQAVSYANGSLTHGRGSGPRIAKHWTNSYWACPTGDSLWKAVSPSAFWRASSPSIMLVTKKSDGIMDSTTVEWDDVDASSSKPEHQGIHHVVCSSVDTLELGGYRYVYEPPEGGASATVYRSSSDVVMWDRLWHFLDRIDGADDVAEERYGDTLLYRFPRRTREAVTLAQATLGKIDSAAFVRSAGELEHDLSHIGGKIRKLREPYLARSALQLAILASLYAESNQFDLPPPEFGSIVKNIFDEHVVSFTSHELRHAGRAYISLILLMERMGIYSEDESHNMIMSLFDAQSNNASVLGGTDGNEYLDYWLLSLKECVIDKDHGIRIQFFKRRDVFEKLSYVRSRIIDRTTQFFGSHEFVNIISKSFSSIAADNITAEQFREWLIRHTEIGRRVVSCS